MSRLKRHIIVALMILGFVIVAADLAFAQTDESNEDDRLRIDDFDEEEGLDEDLMPFGADPFRPRSESQPVLDQQVVEQVGLLLSGYEYFPTAQDLLTVVDEPTPYLLAIAHDEEGQWLPMHRHRAISALAFFPSQTVRAHLQYWLYDAETPELMRHHVLNSLANGFGEDALGDIESFLSSDDLQLRLTAVAAISSIASEQSIEVLQSALDVEPEPLVRERIEEALAAPSLETTTY